MRILPIAVMLTLALSLMACSSNSISPEDDIPHLNEDVGLSFLDENGKDLLNPDHENSFNETNLDIYYLKDGEKSRVFNGNYDLPKNFSIDYAEVQNKYIMTLWLSSHIEDGHTTTYVEYPDGSTDTLKMQAREEAGTVWAEKLWYNGELIWEESEQGSSEPRYFTITKSVK